MATELTKLVPLPSALPLDPPPSFCELNPPVPQKPVINWTRLSKPVESTANKIGRRAGKSLVLISMISGAGRYLAAERMTASPDTIINTCFALKVVTIVSAVGGFVLWFFNRLTVNPAQLLEQRGKLAKEIETTNLSAIRTTYASPFVISNEELNQWIRYLVQKDPFDKFIKDQTDRIFDLPIEEKTKELLKKKYIDHIQNPLTQIDVKTLVNEKAFKFLLSNGTQEEALALKKLIINRAALSLEKIDAVSYRQFIQDQGAENLQDLTEWNLERLFPGFVEGIKEKKVGILQLKRDHPAELKAFGDVMTAPLFQDIANCEGLQPYANFKERNGAEAVSYITIQSVKDDLCASFVSHVVSEKLGAIGTTLTFSNEAERFGQAAKSIYSRVLSDEMNALETGSQTYLQFRRRNGIQNIIFLSVGNPTKFQKYFLELCYANLVDADYKEDRDIMGITDEIIANALWTRWNAMSLKDLLEKDKRGFLSSINRFFSPRAWTQKALDETAALTVIEVMATYKSLFNVKILIASDGNFAQRFADQVWSIPDWKTFVDDYGAFVFENQLLQPHAVQHLVIEFLNQHAESYLSGSYDPSLKKSIALLDQFCLSEDLKPKITTAHAALFTETTRYNDWLSEYEAAHKKVIKDCEDQAEKKIARLEKNYDLPRREREKNTTNKDWLRIKAAHEALEEGIQVCKEKIEATAQTMGEKRASLQELNKRKSYLNSLNILTNSAANEALEQQAKVTLQTAENAVQAKTASVKINTQEKIKNLRHEETELNDKIQKIEALQKEYAQVQAIVEAPDFAEKKKVLLERIANPSPVVTGLKAAEKAKKELAEAPLQLEAIEKNEKRFAELTSLLKQQEPLEPLKNRHRQLPELIQQQQTDMEKFVSSVEVRYGLTQLRANENQASQVASKWRTLALELSTLSQEIKRESGLMSELVMDRDQTIREQNKKTSQLPDSRTNLVLAKTKKELAEAAFDRNSMELAEETGKIRQSCSESIEGYNSEKKQKCEAARFRNAQVIQQIVTTFRQQISAP